MPSIPGPRGPIQYRRDDWGYPSIEARDRVDGAFAHGFLIAEDRMTQVHLSLAVARGRLMEFAGDKPLHRLVDRGMRLHDLERGAVDEAARMRPRTLEVLRAFCAGWNAGMRVCSRPAALRLLGIPNETFTPATIVLLYRFYSFFGLTSQHQFAELAIAELVAGGAPRAVVEMLLGDAAAGFEPQHVERLRVPEGGALLGAQGAGSNAFAVAGTRSKSGGALLMSEFHLEIARLPPTLYVLHMQFPDGGYLQGANLPGVAWPSAGRTAHVAWSYTFAHGDNVDVLVERCENGKYQAAGEWRPLVRRVESVRIRGRREAESLVFHENEYGTIDGEVTEPGDYACVRWNGVRGAASDIDAVIAAETSTSVDELAVHNRDVRVISLHAVLADTSGRIAYVQTGQIDQRPPGWTGAYPRAGHDLATRRPQPLPEAARPIEIDPPGGVIVSANEGIDGPAGERWAACPEPGYRGERLRQLVASGKPLDLNGMAAASYDDMDLGARALCAVWAPHLPAGEEQQALCAWAAAHASPRAPDGARFIGVFHALHEAVVTELLARFVPRERVQRLLDLGLIVSFQHHLDAVLRLERPDLLDATGLGELLGRAWPLARKRALDGKAPAPVRARFKNAYLEGKLPAFLGFDSAFIELPGGPLAPFQSRAIELEGARMVFGPAFHLLFDMSRPGGWYNVAGGASERRFGPGYGKAISEWRDGRFAPLGKPQGRAPELAER